MYSTLSAELPAAAPASAPHNVVVPIELWGGIECTVVRIGDEFRNQVVETGHSARMADLDAMAELGVKTVRYPIVWETVAPQVPAECDFSWHDRRLERLRELASGSLAVWCITVPALATPAFSIPPSQRSWLTMQQGWRGVIRGSRPGRRSTSR